MSEDIPEKIVKDKAPKTKVKPVSEKQRRKLFLNDLVEALQKTGWGKIKIDDRWHYKDKHVQFWTYELERKVGFFKKEPIAIMYEGPEKNQRSIRTMLPGVYQVVQGVVEKHDYSVKLIEQLKVKK